MITKDEIRKQIVCYWSAEDESFIAESAAIPDVIIGLGDTCEQSIIDFESALNNMYDSIKTDKVAGYKQGRPAKNYDQLNVNLRKSTKPKIAALATAFKISQGEAIDYLMFFYERKVNEMAPVMEKIEIKQTIKDAVKNIVGVVKAFEIKKAPSPTQPVCNVIPEANYIITSRGISALSSMQVEQSLLSEVEEYQNAVPLYSGSTIKSEFAYAGGT
jgi:hypothetical protein